MELISIDLEWVLYILIRCVAEPNVVNTVSNDIVSAEKLSRSPGSVVKSSLVQDIHMISRIKRGNNFCMINCSGEFLNQERR